MEHLLALQRLQFGTRPRMVASEVEIGKLREKVPAQILAHYERLVLRGKKGVAIVRGGACGECHLRIPGGKLADLAYTNKIHLCDNCGRYLYLSEEEPLGFVDSKDAPAAPLKESVRKKIGHVL